MNFSKENLRVVIFFNWRLKKTATECEADMIRAFGNDSPSLATIYRWFSRFDGGQVNFEDEPRSGRPATAVCDESIAKARTLIKDNRRITVLELGEALQVGQHAVNEILHGYLKVKKLCARWVPHQLKDVHRQQRIDFCQLMLSNFNVNNPRSYENIITGDETWIFNYDTELKRQSQEWRFEGEETLMNVSKSGSTECKNALRLMEHILSFL